MKSKIRELRKKKHLSQEELVKVMRVTRHTIMALENGKYIVSLPLAHKISKFFGLPIEEVFDLSEVEDIDYDIF